jgi:type I restriction enzyme S subunit
MSTSLARWTRLTFGDVTSEETERLGSSTTDCPVYGVDRSVGLTPTPKYVANDLSRYKRLVPGMFAYNPMRLNIGSIGYCSIKHEPGLVSPDYVVFRCADTRLNPDFLKYYIESADWREWTEGSGVGSVRMRIYYRELARMPITLPPIEEQRAIAHILGILDDKIELNRRLNDTLEAIARALFKSWFDDAIQSGIPKGWREGKVEELATLSRETINPNEFPEETFDHYSIPAFDEGRLPKIECGGQIQSNKFIVPLNAVLLSKLNPRIPRVWLPNISKSHRSICSTEFLVATPQPGVSREYLYSLFVSQSFVEVFSTLVTGTSGSHQRVKPEYLLAMDVLIPPKQLIARFTEAVAPMYQRIAKDIEESCTLAALRDALLPKLISGELLIKDA